jgi:hypothetical protein
MFPELVGFKAAVGAEPLAHGIRFQIADRSVIMFDLEGLLPDRLLQGIRTESAEFQNPERERLVWREFGSSLITFTARLFVVLTPLRR